MNYGLALISKILETKDLSTANKMGVNRPGVLNAEARMYYDILIDHYEQYHQVPSIDMFRDKVPSYTHITVTDTVEALVDRLKTMSLANEMEDVISKLARLQSSDPWAAKALFLQYSNDLAVRHSQGNHYYYMGEDVEETMDRFARLKERKGLEGFPWPWEYFNQNSKGVCGGETYYLYGRQKSKKTFLLLFMAMYYWALGLKVLVFTREMTFSELKYRMLALNGGFDYGRIQKGDLPPGGLERIEAFMREAHESKKLVFTDIQDGISGFQSSIEEIKPDIVFHDYFKAMADDARGSRVSQEKKYVDRVIDQIVDYNSGKAKIPIFLTGHANREGDRSRGRSSTEHAWSDHITRRIHVAFRVVSHEPTNRVALFVNEGRTLQKGTGLTINGKCCEGFGETLSTDYSWATAVDQDEDSQAPRQPQQQQQPAQQSPQSPEQPDGVIDLSNFQ